MKLGVSGHQELPDPARRQVEDAVRDIASAQTGVEVCCSLAAGADQLVAELVIDHGGTLDAVVPSLGYDTTFDDPESLAVYQRLLGQARAVTTLPFTEPGEAAFLAAGLVVVERCELLLAVWDGEPAQGLGGTGDIVAYAHDRGVPVQVVWPQGVER